MAQKDWIKTSKQSWKHKKKLLTVLMPRYQISKNKTKYSVEVIGDFGWTSQHYIKRTGLMSKPQALKFAKCYMGTENIKLCETKRH